MSKRLVILSGPACVGKGPMKAAIDRFFPEICYADIPVIKSKESRPNGPRPGEEKIWNDPGFFRTKEELNELKPNPQYLVSECRGLPQALDLSKVAQSVADVVFIEVYHTLGSQLKESKHLAKYLAGIEVTSVFISPLSKLEILDLKQCDVNLSLHLKGIMLSKLTTRSRFMGDTLTPATVKDLVKRSLDAYAELADAYRYSLVIVNRDGEGSSNWNRSPRSFFINRPEGDAMRASTALASILAGDTCPPHTEVWNEDVMHEDSLTTW